jgi:hypothetical protein
VCSTGSAPAAGFVDWADQAHELIIAADPGRLPAEAGEPAIWEAVQPHLRALLENLPPEASEPLMTRLYIAEWTGEAGDVELARAVRRAAADRRAGCRAPSTPTPCPPRVPCPNGPSGAGRFEEARDLCTELLPIMERVHGTDHQKKLWTWHRMAHQRAALSGSRSEIAPMITKGARAAGVIALHALSWALPLLCMVHEQNDPNEHDPSASTSTGTGGWHVAVAVVNAVFAGLVSLYMATRSIGVVLLGAGLAIVLVTLVVISQRR